jgi:hypothetical protein
MSSPMKLVLAGVFAVALVYFLTANSVLQRVSYDIYECDNRTAGKTKLWFKKVKTGERFEFTRNMQSKFLSIEDVSDNKVAFSDGNAFFKLDLESLRLVRDEKGEVIFFNCKLNAFRM